jgi:hypothetical protein
MFSSKRTYCALFLIAVGLGGIIYAQVTTSPNMGLRIPVVGQDPGPDWANNINASLTIIDGHNHTPGSGVPIPPAGLNINSDLTFQDNNATNLRSGRFYPQSAPLSLGTDLGAIYESGVDLWYNDGNGNQIRLTQSGSIVGTAGSITGLPSGTASASYSSGAFTWQSATNTPATMNVGPLVVGDQVANSNTVTISPNSGIAANYNLSLPAALPGALNYVTLDNIGNLSYNTAGSTGSGAVVLATAPTIAGGTITGSPTFSGNPSFTGNPTFSTGTTTFDNGFTSNGAEAQFTGGIYTNGGGGAFNVGIQVHTNGIQVDSGNIAINGGNLSVSGTTTLHSSGGNVPFGCSRVVASGLSVSCGSGQILTGGGCNTGATALLASYPASTTTWQCAVSGSGGTDAYAICCNY